MSRKKYVGQVAKQLMDKSDMGLLEAQMFVDKIYEQACEDNKELIEHYKEIITLRETIQKQHEEMIANLERQMTIMENTIITAKQIISKQEELLILERNG